LNYKYSINNKHNFESTVLYEYFKTNFRSYTLKLCKWFLRRYSSGWCPSTGRTERATISVFGNIDYDFDGKYLVSLYGRRDGASVLGTNNKYEFAKELLLVGMLLVNLS
jgi:hypothetical protein